MSLLVFQHSESGTSGRLGGILQRFGNKLRVVQLYKGEAVPPDLDDVDGVISLGGPMNVGDREQHPWIDQELAFLKTAYEADLPIVGICLGAQLLATALGGEVAPMAEEEIGFHNVKLGFPGTTDPLHAGIGWDTMQFHMHGQEITKLPPGAVPLSGSKLCRTQALRIGVHAYAFQYHFEMDKAGIERMAHQRLGPSSPLTTADLLAQAERYYPQFQRVADRLCNAIAMLLFAIDKRVATER